MQLATNNTSLVLQINVSKKKVINVPCENFLEASKTTSAFISKNDLGSSRFLGAIILHPFKGAFARVSYNGRVWEGISEWPCKEITNLTSNDIN